jgi:hypothetical protein
VPQDARLRLKNGFGGLSEIVTNFAFRKLGAQSGIRFGKFRRRSLAPNR